MNRPADDLVSSEELVGTSEVPIQQESAPGIVGIWEGDDGSGIKMINADGSCSGMYYNGRSPLDIGGPMTCVLGLKSGNGNFTMLVRQSPNEHTYRVTFDGDLMTLSDSNGVLVNLTRQ